MGELLSEFGDLVFSLVIGYIGAIEFLYVVRHLYHWSFNHEAAENGDDADYLARLQDNMQQQLANATKKESEAGTQVMKDGVQYREGFRIDPLQKEIEKLKEQLKNQELNNLKRQELEKELTKLQKEAENLRKELEKVEANKRKEEQEKARKLKEAEEKRKKEEEQAKREAEENQRKLVEAEKQREAEQRKKEEELAKKEAEENQRKLKEEAEQRKKEEEQTKREAEENQRKIIEAEKQKEAEQRKQEEEQAKKEEEENQLKIMENEKQKEAQQRKQEEAEQAKKEAEESQLKIIEAKKQREAEQRLLKEQEEFEENSKRLEAQERSLQEQQALAERLQEEAEEEENERKFLEIEHKLEEQLRAAEQESDLTEKEKQLIESIKNREIMLDEDNEQKEDELLKRILEARDQLSEESEEEQSRRLIERERDHEKKQKRIEENALLFLEAEKEMAAIQSQMQEGVEKRIYAANLDSAPQTPILEEPCIKKTVAPLLEDDHPVAHRVKTQLAQDLHDSFSVSSKPLLFPGVSDEGSSVEPISSQQSSFSTQPSEEITTGPDSQYPPRQERQEPDGEDTTPSLQYSEDYLRSLDGIKQRPLLREDGSGRRRAFKKRRSSNSSNSSRESRTSRDEELKMFTSLEEEEMNKTGESEFTPIRYTSEPTLKVKGHHRRHKRSPAKDMKTSDDSLRSSLERLGEEESSNPWGEVQPEHYKNTEFWKREKALSIDEEIEFERPASSEEISYDTATNMPSASSFEEATQIQNEQALTALRKQASKDTREEEPDDTATDAARSDNKTNLQTSSRTEKETSPARSSASPRLRRSPRIEEMDQYEERWKESKKATTSPPQTSQVNTPTITVQTPLDFGTWRDEHGLMMEGLSDFYDFTASVNPSRSRNASRNPSPANTAPNTPLPKDVSFDLEIPNAQRSLEATVEIFDDTDDLESQEFKKENIIKFIDSLNENGETNKENNDTADENADDEEREDKEEDEYQKDDEMEEEEKDNEESEDEKEDTTESVENSLQNQLQYVMDAESSNKSSLVPMVNIIDDSSQLNASENDAIDDMNSLVASLRNQRSDRSRSRSKSPLPTPGNLARSLENRRNKMIKHNEDVLEKLIETNLLPETPPPQEDSEDSSYDNMNAMVNSLTVERSSSRPSRSRSRSPLPTPGNIERSLEHRRHKRIQENDEIFERLNSPERSSESPVVVNSPERRSESPVILNSAFVDSEEIVVSKEGDLNYDSSNEKMDSLVAYLRVDRSRSRSKSPMRLPTADNLNKSINSRRHKLIEHNDDIKQQLEERTNTPESPNITVEYVYEYESSEVNEMFEWKTQSPVILNTPTISIESAETDEVSTPQKDNETDDCSREQMDLLVQSLRVARSRSRSKSPMRLPTAANLDKSIDLRRHKLIERNDEISQQLDERAATPDSPSITMEYVYEYEESSETQSSHTFNAPTISIEFDDSDQISTPKLRQDNDDCSRENMDLLVQSLRVARSRSRSRTPMRQTTAEDSGDESNKIKRSRHSRSQSPPRSISTSPKISDRDHNYSRTPSRSLSPSNETAEYNDFHVMLNLEGSQNRTIAKNSEELETLKLERQRRVDEEALETLKYANEEMELRTLSPLVIDRDELQEQESRDYLGDLPATERSRILRKSPTTPDYDRTISEEMRDVERIKQEMLGKGFKRSTYVGESLDMGSEFEPLRREAADFQRSRSPSPTFSRTDIETARLEAEKKRQIQDMILAELTGSPSEANQTRNTGAIPKTERFSSTESDLSLSKEIQDTLRIKEEMLTSGFQRSTYEGESVDLSLKFDEMRRRNAEFRRSASKSRSPLQEAQIEALAEIEKEASKRELQDRVLDEISNNSMNFQEFSRNLNPNFFENDRRASDSALMQKPEILVQLQDTNYDSVMDMEPDEYHHYRRFSLAQEQPAEEYPSDDYIYIQEVEVRTQSGSRTWIREDYYSENVNEFLIRNKDEEEEKQEEMEERGIKSSPEIQISQEESEEVYQSTSNDQEDSTNSDQEEILQEYDEDNDALEDDEEYSNNSDDDRQTVVEVDDEIDEDISDFNERGPAEESHHETSECEEAEREMDRYADREASDWTENIIESNLRNDNPEEGAVGGSSSQSSPYDSDSFAIDQIYDEAIKNRKQSGILREYDSILMQMSNSDVDEHYAIWSKTQGKKKPKNIEFNLNFLESERKDSERRYLGDAKVSERQSIRLRSRYGYNPVLQTGIVEDEIEVDLNYKPKREYNWRKNFKIEDDESEQRHQEDYPENNNNEMEPEYQDEIAWDENNANEENINEIDIRKYSVGGESITLFSRSPDRGIIDEDLADNADNEEINQDCPPAKDVYNDVTENIEDKVEKVEKPKKKKTKKKTRKESRGSIDLVNPDEEDVPDSYIYSRRSSSIQMDTDSPKRKSRSRRSSKSSITNDEAVTLFSPRSSVGYAEPIADIMEEYTETVQEVQRPKKIKKRKKIKEIMAEVAESPREYKEELLYNEPLENIEPVSTILTPESSSVNILSTLSPQNSVCVTPASEIEINENLEDLEKDNTVTVSPPTAASTTNSSRTPSITSPVDTFDILKDANFYPLF